MQAQSAAAPEERLEEFEAFFAMLCAADADSEQLAAAFRSLYQDGWRHSYSEITRLMTAQFRDAEQYEEAFGSCLQNLLQLEHQLLQAEDADEPLKRHYAMVIFKLRDHLNLENYRLKYIGTQFEDSLAALQDIRELQQGLRKLDHKYAEQLHA